MKNLILIGLVVVIVFLSVSVFADNSLAPDIVERYRGGCTIWIGNIPVRFC